MIIKTDPSRLYTALLNTGLQQKDNPLYQVIHDLIGQLVNVNKVTNIIGGGGSSSVINQTTIIQQLLDSSSENENGNDSSWFMPANMASKYESNIFTTINPIITLPESWIGPSSTTGIYFKGGQIGIGTITPTRLLDLGYGHLGFITVPKPTAPSGALAGVAGNVDNGTHYYTVTYLTADGETEMSNESSVVTVIDKTTNGKVTVTIPVSTNANVTGRNIYRTTISSTAELKLLITVGNNTALTYLDNTADSGLTGALIDFNFTSNSTAGKIYSDSTLAVFSGKTTTLLGKNAGNAKANVIWNTAIGSAAGNALTTGTRNVFIGDHAGQGMTSGGNNIFVGQESGFWATIGSNNTLIGQGIWSANSGTTTYSGITAIGAAIGNENTAPTERVAYVGSNSTFIGYLSGPTGTGITNSIAIGYLAKTTADNQVVIGNTSITQTLLNGNVGIGVTGPTAVLQLKAGTAAASTAPFKLTSGVNLITAEAGAIEFTMDDFFATITTGAARKAFILDNGSRLTSGKIPVATTNGRLIDSTGPLLVASGVSSVVASTFEKSETGSDANVLTYTTGAADEFLNIKIATDVSAITGASIVVTITWKDSNNTTATSKLTLTAIGDGTINIPINAFTATNVVVSSVFVGVSTAYKISAIIVRLK
jgi:hypothetical protein